MQWWIFEPQHSSRSRIYRASVFVPSRETCFFLWESGRVEAANAGKLLERAHTAALIYWFHLILKQ